MTRKLYLDCESSALPLEQLPPIMPEFEPAANLRDPEKIKASIADKQTAWLDGAALKPTTGKVIAASMCKDDQKPIFVGSFTDEAGVLGVIYQAIQDTIGQGGQVYGFNIFGFDLPFLAGRCAVHGIPAFKNFTVNYRGRWSWVENFIDPMQIWCGPGQRHDGASLKNVAFALGLGLKEGNGKDFAALLQSDPEAARRYAVNDVELLRGVVNKMGL